MGNIWDTAGQDRFRSITRNYFRGSNGIMLVFNVANLSSFKNIKKWVNQIRQTLHDDVSITLIGNKCDLEEERKVQYEEAEEIAKEFDMDYYETSAKMNFNISEAFSNLFEKMLVKYKIGLEREEEEVRKNRNESVRIFNDPKKERE